MQHIHILGICGTFMGSLAQLAKASGLRVTGCDEKVYPPMSDQLERAGIELIEGFDPAQLALAPDLFVVGNVVRRGNPLMEAILNRNLPYTSGPEWLARTLLQQRWVLAVAGTHGKTTTASMLTWLLQAADYQPGYLIGGVPQNFEASAALGTSDFFVIEADEYDCAFFDKRSKFIHYRPRTLIINNLEYDHADIFPDLNAIQTQFHHLVRCVPGDGLIVAPAADPAVAEVLRRGVWTPVEALGSNWRAELHSADGSDFDVIHEGAVVGRVRWQLTGAHNVANALAALAAARNVGLPAALGAELLAGFKGVKRRMEQVGAAGGAIIYDDFAHHPTAIATTLAGLRARFPQDRITAVIEPRSNTMRMGVHAAALTGACEAADRVLWLERPGVNFQLAALPGVDARHSGYGSAEAIIAKLVATRTAGEHIVIMSNGGFDGIHRRLLTALSQQE